VSKRTQSALALIATDMTEPADPTPQRGKGLLQIGEVAERVGLSLRTVRYYEEQGLLEPESRSPGGFRLYSTGQVDRLALIKQMKPLGFTVQEMRELLDARDSLHSAPDSAAAAAAAARLASYADAADTRCAKLAEQLEQAKGLAGQLRHEAGDRRGASAEKGA
jgi:DNA-binding transcriptional MerR regulator